MLVLSILTVMFPATDIEPAMKDLFFIFMVCLTEDAAEEYSK